VWEYVYTPHARGELAERRGQTRMARRTPHMRVGSW